MKKSIYDSARKARQEPVSPEDLRRNRIGCAVLVVIVVVLYVLQNGV